MNENDLGDELKRSGARILFHLEDFGKGGTETALIAWLHALQDSHFKVAVCVSFPTDDLTFWQETAFPAGMPVFVLASSRWMVALHERRRQHRLTKGWKILKNVLTYGILRPVFRRKIRKLAENFDVIFDYDMSLRYLAGHFGIAWLGANHFSIVARFGNVRAKTIARRQAQLLRYNAITVQTGDMLAEARMVFPALSEKLEQLPNIIDRTAVWRRALEPFTRPATPYIVSVARLDEGQKDHRTLLEAYAKMRESGIATHELYVVGEGPHRAQLDALANELGISATVRFMGFQANPFPLIRNADALVLSSRYEGFGMVLAEAMALRVPVISTDCPTGPADLLDDGKAGLLVPVGDAITLGIAMGAVLTDDDLKTRLVERASERLRMFDPIDATHRLAAVVARIRSNDVNASRPGRFRLVQ